LDSLTGVQISEWEAYDRIDPIGEWRDDFRMAKIESLLVNIVNALYHKEHEEPKTTTPMDFMMKWGEDVEEIEPQQQSAEEMKEVFKSIATVQDSKTAKERREAKRKKLTK
jgi:hypothetical protein